MSHTPPNSLEAEQAVLGAMLVDDTKLKEAFDYLDESDFYDMRHQKIFQRSREAVLKSGKLDLLILAEALQSQNELKMVGGRAYLCELTESVTTTSFLKSHALIIKQKSSIRKMQNAIKNIASITISPNGSDEDTISRMHDAGIDAVRELIIQRTSTEEITLDQALEDVLVDRSQGTDRGIDTGIGEIDDVTVGLKPGHLWILGGYTSVGKTQLSLIMAANIAEAGHDVVIYSLEMTTKDIAGRLLDIAKRRTLDHGKAIDFVHQIAQKIRVVTSKTTLEQIEADVICSRPKPPVVIVDFIQNVETSDNKEYDRMSTTARRLQKLALQEGISVLALSQIDNESARNPNRSTMGFKGSGSIAAACDVGIELQPDGEQTGDVIDVICWIKKNRHGRKAKLSFEYNKAQNHFIFRHNKVIESNQSQSNTLDFDKQ